MHWIEGGYSQNGRVIYDRVQRYKCVSSANKIALQNKDTLVMPVSHEHTKKMSRC